VVSRKPGITTMMGNLTAVTAAPARTSAPSGHDSAPSALPAGKGASTSGEDLPAARAAAAAQDLQRTLRKLNDRMAAEQRNLSFRVDEGSGRTVITVLDSATKEVIRQIPSEEVLALSRALEAASGLLDAHA
jgi:flagellar protein FlaG